MNLETFYKNKIILNSKNNILEYLSRFKDKKIILFFEKDTYSKYKDILNLDSLNIINFINIANINKKISIDTNTTILILVKNFYHDLNSFKYLYDNNLYQNDICTDILLDMDIVKKDTFNFLWENITKLENNLHTKDINFIINNNHTSYIDLFYILLLKNNLISNKYAYALIYLERYKDTFGNLSQNLNNLIIFFDKPSIENNYFFGLDYLRFFSFISIFIGTTSAKLPAKSKHININHGIIDDPNPILSNIKNTDTINHSFYAKKSKSPIDINIVSSKILQTDNSISLGYPKLDKFIDYYTRNKNNHKLLIVIAISTIMWNCETITPIIQDSEFIYNILKKFPKYKIMLRPHPSEIDHDYIKDYSNKLNYYTNFELDREKSYLENFTNAKVFISDGLGSSAYTYAFATLKPVIFYIPKLKKYMNDYGDKYYVKNLNIIGDIATNQLDLINLINKYLSNKNYVNSKSIDIKKLRDKNIFNIGSSEKQILSFIKNYIITEQFNLIKNYYQNKFIKTSKIRINNYFDKFKDKKLAIYGAGEHFTTVLMQIYDFTKLNIKYFSDSNVALIGKKILNYEIVSKNSLDNVDIILISSKKYEKEIKKDLLLKYNNVHTIYEELNHEIAFYMNNPNDKTLRNLWLNIQIIEKELKIDDINIILNNNYSNYAKLLNHCKSLLKNKYNKKINYSDDLKDIYLNNSLYCIN